VEVKLHTFPVYLKVVEVKLHTFPVVQFTAAPWLIAMPRWYLKVVEVKLHTFPVYLNVVEVKLHTILVVSDPPN